jgi:hypothetical protein
MESSGKSKRWPIALVIIAIVVIISAVIIYSYRDAPGRIPISAVSGSSGDTIVTWQDSGGIYAQRLNLSGQPLWGEDGLLIAESPPDKSYTLISDGLGGAIFTWYESTHIDHEDPDYFSPVTFYARRINADGELMWDDGVLIGDSNRHGVDFPAVVPDGSGGAIFVWNDYKPFYKALHEDILRIKKFDAGGRSLWGSEGIPITASTSYHELTEDEIAAGIKGTYARSWPTYSGQFTAVNDGAGGAIVIWEEEITSKSERVFAQRFNDRGDAVWPDRLTVAGEGFLCAESDGAGGAIVWTPEGTVYSGIGTVGTPLMVNISGDGEILSSRSYDSSATYLNDGLGGFIRIRIEEDPPSGPPWDRRTTLYVQRQDTAGKALWPEVRVIDPGEKEQFADLEYIADGTGGVIIVWQLQRDSVPIGGIMAQRVDTDGTLCWREEGIPVFGGSRIRYQGIAGVLGDGSGGVTVIAALGTGALSGDMVYAQKLDAGGNRLWGDGVMINR